jgi:hypothetical protein
LAGEGEQVFDVALCGEGSAAGGEQVGAGEVHAGTGCHGTEESGAGEPPVQQCFVGADRGPASGR